MVLVRPIYDGLDLASDDFSSLKYSTYSDLIILEDIGLTLFPPQQTIIDISHCILVRKYLFKLIKRSEE